MSKDPRPELVEILHELNPSAATEDVRRYAEQLHMVRIFGAVGDLPLARAAGSKTASRALATVARKAALLKKQLLALPSDALREFEKMPPGDASRPPVLHPLALVDALDDFARTAWQAGTTVPPTERHKGNRHRVQPRRVAITACKIFKLLTGKAGGRIHDPYGDKKTYGPLHQFVSDVFRALSIQASADGQLKAILSTTRPLRK